MSGYTTLKVTSLRHKHVGREVRIDNEDALDVFALTEVTGTIESLSCWSDGVSIGVDYWDDSENCFVSVDVEFGLDDHVDVGGRA